MSAPNPRDKLPRLQNLQGIPKSEPPIFPNNTSTSPKPYTAGPNSAFLPNLPVFQHPTFSYAANPVSPIKDTESIQSESSTSDAESDTNENDASVSSGSYAEANARVPAGSNTQSDSDSVSAQSFQSNVEQQPRNPTSSSITELHSPAEERIPTLPHKNTKPPLPYVQAQALSNRSEVPQFPPYPSEDNLSENLRTMSIKSVKEQQQQQPYSQSQDPMFSDGSTVYSKSEIPAFPSYDGPSTPTSGTLPWVTPPIQSTTINRLTTERDKYKSQISSLTSEIEEMERELNEIMKSNSLQIFPNLLTTPPESLEQHSKDRELDFKEILQIQRKKLAKAQEEHAEVQRDMNRDEQEIRRIENEIYQVQRELNATNAKLIECVAKLNARNQKMKLMFHAKSNTATDRVFFERTVEQREAVITEREPGHLRFQDAHRRLDSQRLDAEREAKAAADAVENAKQDIERLEIQRAELANKEALLLKKHAIIRQQFPMLVNGTFAVIGQVMGMYAKLEQEIAPFHGNAPPGPAPKCIECQEEEAFFAQAWKCYSKFCSIDCQRDNEQYLASVGLIKTRIAKSGGNPLSPFEEHDIPPPHCKQCGVRARFYDYSIQNYTNFCGKDGCENRNTPAQRPNNSQQYANQYGNQPAPAQMMNNHLHGAGTFPVQNQVVQTRKKGMAGWKEPTAETQRPMYQTVRSGTQQKCVHCCRVPAQPNTSQGLFCTFQCEQRESSVLGAGVLISTADKVIVILGLMSKGAYAGLFSFFHDSKHPDELARDACRRIANEQVRGKIQVSNNQPYTLAKHSAPNVFSYIVMYMSNEDLIKTLPPQDRNLPVAHLYVSSFRDVQMDPDNRKGYVNDVFGQRIPVSRMTIQVVTQNLLTM
ncbi:hypothetical protein HK098_006063 [Nowakowskiella sp. JEL0407]|nr:hypothetical protein HK098_006063 [Nowakowskiella sp. JEL0407]